MENLDKNLILLIAFLSLSIFFISYHLIINEINKELESILVFPITEKVAIEGIKRFGGKIEKIESEYLIVYDPAKNIKEKFFLSPDVPIKQTIHFMPKDPFSGTIKSPEVIASIPLEDLEKGDDVIIFYTKTKGRLVSQRIELLKFKYE